MHLISNAQHCCNHSNLKKLLTEPEIITRLDECVVFQNCETNCRHTVKQSPIYATPPFQLVHHYQPTASHGHFSAMLLCCNYLKK